MKIKNYLGQMYSFEVTSGLLAIQILNQAVCSIPSTRQTFMVANLHSGFRKVLKKYKQAGISCIATWSKQLIKPSYFQKSCYFCTGEALETKKLIIDCAESLHCTADSNLCQVEKVSRAFSLSTPIVDKLNECKCKVKPRPFISN